MNQKKLFINVKNKKIKMKKNALDPVDFEEEKRKDPKYKTELCKSWIETGFCVYGNKCRFAHGKHELYNKSQTSNYKRKMCKSFLETGYCPYGSRCNFKHEERKLNEINFPYYTINLFINNQICPPGKRLKIFEDITNEHKADYFSDSTSLSNDENNNDCNHDKSAY